MAAACFNTKLKADSENQALLEAMRTVFFSICQDDAGLEWKYRFTSRDPFYQSYAQSAKVIEKKAKHYIELAQLKLVRDSVRKSCDQSSGASILQSLLQKKSLPMRHVTNIIESILIRGPSAGIFPLVLYNLATHPSKQDMAAREVISVLGPDGNITSETLSELRYLKACVRESMRVFFPSTNGISRILSDDAVLSGYVVPRNTQVVMNNKRIAKNPEHFPSPELFMPERWLRQQDACPIPSIVTSQQDGRQEGPRPPPFSNLPFGHGPRNCVGRHYAEQEIHVGVAKILQRLKVKVDPAYRGIEELSDVHSVPFLFEKRLT